MLNVMVLPICACDVILEMAIVTESIAIIDLPGGMISLVSGFPDLEECDAGGKLVRLAYLYVTLLPR